VIEHRQKRVDHLTNASSQQLQLAVAVAVSGELVKCYCFCLQPLFFKRSLEKELVAYGAAYDNVLSLIGA
jgi:hypothetical protein